MIPQKYKNKSCLPIISSGTTWRYKTCAEMLADEIDKNEKKRKEEKESEKVIPLKYRMEEEFADFSGSDNEDR
jgi:hypothetical protein